MSGKNHEQSELELFRREILNKDGMIEVLQNNIKELQGQLQQSYKRIEELNQELSNVKVCECPPIVSGVDGVGKPY
jgi:predicted RNase H-like nuclease (RuvC/YqgF family)